MHRFAEIVLCLRYALTGKDYCTQCTVLWRPLLHPLHNYYTAGHKAHDSNKWVVSKLLELPLPLVAIQLASAIGQRQNRTLPLPIMHSLSCRSPPSLRSLSAHLPPHLRLLPYPAARIILVLILVNLVVWAIVGIILHSHPLLASSALLSYTLGLRHALDADHISAIDLMTRRLVATGSKPVTVGMWFSLGHSTIVVGTCIVVAATSGALEKRFEGFRNVAA